MHAKLLCFSLFVAQIIFNESSVIREERDADSVQSETPPTNASLNLPEGYVSFPEDHAAFKLYDKTLATWTQARDNCVAEGARLAIANTIRKIRHINSLRQGVTWHWIHVGFHKLSYDGDWLRADNGLPAGTLPWQRRYPRDYQKCAGISVYYNSLVDYVCDSTREEYACEIPI